MSRNLQEFPITYSEIMSCLQVAINEHTAWSQEGPVGDITATALQEALRIVQERAEIDRKRGVYVVAAR